MNLYLVLAAFGGGIFGALLSGTGAFIMVGITGLVGVGAIAASGNTSILTDIAFGPFFGPHVAFVGGVAAAAYAGNKKQYITTGADINTPLVFTKDPVVLVIAGLFGVIGYFINNMYAQFLPPMDTVALTVVTCGIICRLMFGSSGLIGAKELSIQDSSGRYTILGSELLFDLLIAIGLSSAVSFAAINLQIPEIGFVISAFSLIFLYTTPGGGPVTHHLTVTAGVAAVHTGNPLYGIMAGVLACVLFEFLGVRTFNKYQDTHIDPPAVAIAITSLIVLNIFPKV